MAKKKLSKALKDFWYGKPHTAEEGGRRLGEILEDKTQLYKHREWRGVKDTFYYMYMIWGYNYVHMVTDILKYSNNPIDFFKGTWRYRWMGQTYLPVIHWFDRGLQGMRGEALQASAWHYRAMVSASIQQICNFFNADTRLHGGRENDAYKHSFLAKETTWGGLFYPWMDAGYQYIPIEMIPYFVTCHVNSHTVLNYIDAAQSIGLPGDPCPMCQAEAGIYVLDDVPDSSPLVITCNEACDGSVGTAILQDWFIDKPLFALPLPMQFDDPLVKQYCMREIEECWKFIEEQTGEPLTGSPWSSGLRSRTSSSATSGRSGKSPARPTTTPSTASPRPCSASSPPSTVSRATSGTRPARRSRRSCTSASRRRSIPSRRPATA